MIKFFRSLFIDPFIFAFTAAYGLWNKSGDWGWHISARLLGSIIVLGGLLFFVVWAFVGFQWPFFGTQE
jgi:hypothetical protein